MSDSPYEAEQNEDTDKRKGKRTRRRRRERKKAEAEARAYHKLNVCLGDERGLLHVFREFRVKLFHKLANPIVFVRVLKPK